jgi:hypothetical protein
VGAARWGRSSTRKLPVRVRALALQTLPSVIGRSGHARVTSGLVAAIAVCAARMQLALASDKPYEIPLPRKKPPTS